MHAAYVDSVAAALHPVFLAAGFISVIAFFFALLLREVPLRVREPNTGAVAESA